MKNYFQFQLLKTAKNSRARLGRLQTAHGEIATPAFMPVGTQGTVKGLTPDDLRGAGSQIILGNTYHLYLRPGLEILRRAGGLHEFANWKFPLLTDSGGFQVFSLAGLRKIHANGVRFQSHLDGGYHEFTPENVMEKQRVIGADIIMAFDECPPFGAEKKYIAESNLKTIAWAKRCKDDWRKKEPLYGYQQALFGIVQGGTFPEIRRTSAEALIEIGFPGYALGGLAVGEPAESMYEMTELTTEILPQDKPRYLMGVGKPENLVESVYRGVDMFDCVIPTRNGRKGQAFGWHGAINLRNAKFKSDFSPIDSACECYCCRRFTRAYLRHLFHAKELLGMKLTSLHNIFFFNNLMAKMREAIEKDDFENWRGAFYQNYKIFNQRRVA